MFKMKNKIALAVTASAVCLSGGVFAQADLSASPQTTNSYASEFSSAASAATPLTLTGVGVISETPIAINTATLRYVRYDFTTATITAATTPTMALVANSDAGTLPNVVLVEGGAGNSFAIFSVETANGAVADDVDFGDDYSGVFSLDVESTSDVSASVAIYETQAEASVGGTGLGATVSGTVASFTPGLLLTATATDATAEVTVNFVSFDNGAGGTTNTAAMGSAQLGVSGALLPATGVAGVLTDFIAADGDADLVVEGDSSFANNATAVPQAGAVTFGATAATTAATDTFTITDIGNADLDNGGVLGAGAVTPIAFTSQTNESMPESAYTVSVNVTAAVGTAVYTGLTKSLGSINRNGTNVDIPYITTFADYNQRLILVNRSNAAAGYTVTFTEESGVTATAGTAASGTIPADETVIVKMTDVVTLAGGTRTAGFVSIVAAPNNIDVATTQVNLSDASTDTVVLD